MIELLNVSLSLVTILLLATFPLSPNFLRKKVIFSKNYVYDYLSINLFLHILIIFFMSFTKINFTLYFYILLILLLIFSILNFFKLKNSYKFFYSLNFILFFFTFLLICMSLSGDPTLTWDGIENWYFKAQNFFYNYNFFDLNDIRGINYYPHLGGLIWGFFWKNSLLQYEYVGRFVFVFIFLLSIFSLSELLKNEIAKPIFQILITLICYDRFLFGGYQDVLLFSLLIFLSKYFYLYMINQDRKILILCFIFLNLLPWIKNEGYLFVAVFSLSLIIFSKLFFNKIDIIFFVIFSILCVIIKKYIFFKYLNLNPTHGANLDFIFNIEEIIEFFIVFSKGIVVAIFKYKIWLFILLTIFYIFLNLKIFNKDKIFIYFLIVNLFLYSLLVFIIYFDYLNEPRGLYWWIHTTLDRLLYSISGFFIILLVLVINRKDSYIFK